MKLPKRHAQRVLVVSAQARERSELAAAIGARGYHVEAVASPGEAVRAMRRAVPGVLLLLDDQDGSGWAELVDCFQRFPRPFLISRASPPALRPAGIDAIWSPTWSPEQLVDLVQRALPRVDAPTLPRLQRGAHIMLTYTSHANLLDALAAYLAGGLEDGDRCLLACEDEAISDLARFHLRRLGLAVDRHERSGALRLLTHAECYLMAGHFESQVMLGLLRDFIQDSRAAGFAGLRFAGGGSWVPATPEDRAAWFRYEHDSARLFRDGYLTGLCLYAVDDFAPRELAEALGAHPYLLDGWTLCHSRHFGLGALDEDKRPGQQGIDSRS